MLTHRFGQRQRFSSMEAQKNYSVVAREERILEVSARLWQNLTHGSEASFYCCVREERWGQEDGKSRSQREVSVMARGGVEKRVDRCGTCKPVNTGGPSTLILLYAPSIRPANSSTPLHVIQLMHSGPIVQGSAPGQTGRGLIVNEATSQKRPKPGKPSMGGFCSQALFCNSCAKWQDSYHLSSPSPFM